MPQMHYSKKKPKKTKKTPKKEHWILMKTMNNLNFNLKLTRIVHCLQIIISDISYCGIFGEHSIYLDFCIS